MSTSFSPSVGASHRDLIIRVAAVQMVSTPVVRENMAVATDLISKAVDAGAKIVALPEYFCLLGHKDTDKLKIREVWGDGPIQSSLADLAKKHGIWLIGGTIPIDCGSEHQVLNTIPVYSPEGVCVARYDKIHLFAFSRVHPDGRKEEYDENRSIRPGLNRPVTFDTGTLKVGLAVCYDLRFPEIYRQYAGVDLIVIPSAFTATTGVAHWEVLLRARAIENLAYVLAPAQGGKHLNGRSTFGHTMLVDPWGGIVQSLPSGAGIVVSEIDLNYMDTCRTNLPALQHRRTELLGNEGNMG